MDISTEENYAKSLIIKNDMTISVHCLYFTHLALVPFFVHL